MGYALPITHFQSTQVKYNFKQPFDLMFPMMMLVMMMMMISGYWMRNRRPSATHRILVRGECYWNEH